LTGRELPRGREKSRGNGKTGVNFVQPRGGRGFEEPSKRDLRNGLIREERK